MEPSSLWLALRVDVDAEAEVAGVLIRPPALREIEATAGQIELPEREIAGLRDVGGLGKFRILAALGSSDWMKPSAVS